MAAGTFQHVPAYLGAALGAGGGIKATVRDLWAKKTLGVFDGRYPASGGVTVAPHEAKMLRVTPAGEAEGAEYAF